MNPLRIFLLAALVLVVFGVGNAEAVTFGGADDDRAKSGQQTSDGGYIITGYTESFGNGSGDVWLIKLDYDKKEEWNRTFGGSGFDGGRDVKQTTDGGYIITGRVVVDPDTSPFCDLWLIKTDSEGNKEWDQTFGESNSDTGKSVQQTEDGGFIVVGGIYENFGDGGGGDDAYLIKTDSYGNEEWIKQFGNGEYDNDYGEEVLQDDQSYIIVGSTYINDEQQMDVWLIKVNSDGDKVWNRTFGGSDWDLAYSIDKTTDGGYIMTGHTKSFGNGDYDVWLIKVDSDGIEEWNKTFGGSDYELGQSIRKTSDGGYIITGQTESFGNGKYDVWLIEVNSEGIEEWNKTFGGPENDVGQSVKPIGNGQYIITGYTESFGNGKSDFWFLGGSTLSARIDSISPSTVRFDAEVIFNGTGFSDDTVVAYEWKSDIDGFLSDEEDFNITGFSVGTHTISFRIQNNHGDWSEWSTATLTVVSNVLPVATIDSIVPLPARFDAEVTFSGSGSDSDGTVVAYEWASNIDGFLSDERDFNITGFSVGTHTIHFRVQDNDGDWSEWDTTAMEIYPNALPAGTIDYIAPSPAKEGTTVFFNGTSSDSDGTVVAYQWKSSIDSELSIEANFNSNSLSLGHHTITFRVQDNDGDWSDSTSESLWIYAVPVAFAGQDSTGTPGVPLQFSGAATDEDGTVVLYEWDFDGDGIFEWSSTENGRELNIYNNEGTYTATLRVTDNEGFTGTDTVEITISEKKIQIDDDGNVIVEDAGEDEEGIPSISLITSLISIGLLAIFRRK